MMDQTYIDAILSVIMDSDLKSSIKFIELRPTVCSVESNRRILHTTMELSEVISSRRAELSKAWIASNLIMFAVFDGYLESEYPNLEEGASFRNHYNNLPDSSEIDLIRKDCYRIMKLLRNAAQHSLSGVVHDDNGYTVDYIYHNTNYRLKITNNSVNCLYTMIVNFISNRIMGLSKDYHTPGHFDAAMRMFYEEMCKGIEYLHDDIRERTQVPINGTKLRLSLRYPIINLEPLCNSNKLIFEYIRQKVCTGPNGEGYSYPLDYAYGDYILPEEIGSIRLDPELGYEVIEFDKSVLNDSWKRS